MNKYLLTFLIPTLGLTACVSSGSSSPNTATPEPPKSGSASQQPKSGSSASSVTPPAKPTRNPNSLGVKASDPVTALLKAELEVPETGILNENGTPTTEKIDNLEKLAHKKFNATDPSTSEQITYYFQIQDGGLLRTKKNIDDTQTLVTELFYLQPDSYYVAAIPSDTYEYHESSYDGTKLDFNSLPQSGTSTYTGSAVSAKADGSGFVTGKLDMEVNWGSKQVTSGTITITDGSNSRNITLQQGNITADNITGQPNSNKYEGTVTENGTNGSYEGSFFGNDAGETAGLVTFKPKSNLASVSPSPTGKKDVAFGGRKSK